MTPARPVPPGHIWLVHDGQVRLLPARHAAALVARCQARPATRAEVIAGKPQHPAAGRVRTPIEEDQ